MLVCGRQNTGVRRGLLEPPPSVDAAMGPDVTPKDGVMRAAKWTILIISVASFIPMKQQILSQHLTYRI